MIEIFLPTLPLPTTLDGGVNLNWLNRADSGVFDLRVLDGLGIVLIVDFLISPSWS